MSSRELEIAAPPANRSRLVGLLAPVLLLLFLLLASLFWRAGEQGNRKSAPDPCHALVRAAELGDLVAVESLLKQGCSANYQRPGVLSGPTDQTDRLRLQTRSDRSRFAGTPLLEIAAQNNDLPLLKLLLQRGAAIDGRGVYGYTALIRAATRANAEVVSLLLRAGANPNLCDTVFSRDRPAQSHPLRKPPPAGKCGSHQAPPKDRALAAKKRRGPENNG